MKPRLSEQLKKLLEITTQEQFDKDWAAVEALGLEGPFATEFIEYAFMCPIIAPISIVTGSASKLNDPYNNHPSVDDSFLLAA